MKTIPRLSGLPLLGNLLDFKKDRLSLFQNIHDRFGEIGAYTLFSKPFAVTSNAEYIRQMLIDHHTDFERSPVMLMMKPILGEGLLTTNNTDNSYQRQWLMPVFHADRFPGYAQMIGEQVQTFQQSWVSGQSLDLSAAMQQLTLSIIGKSMFSTDIFQNMPDFIQSVTNLLQYTDQRVKFLLPIAWPLPINRKLNATMKPLNRIIDTLIEERKHSSSQADDLLSILLQARDEKTHLSLTNRQIGDQILTFLFAGHETTANTLGWTFYLLAKNPSVAERLQAELEAVLKGETPTYNDLKRLPYSLQVIKESLRLYPAAYAFGRTALKDLVLGDYRIQKNGVVLACPYVMHRNLDYFHDPLLFNPDRFLPEQEALIPRFAYLPFGAGPRSCIGRQFAFMEIQLILVLLVRHYRFTLLDEEEIQPESMITLRPKSPIRVKVHSSQKRLSTV